MFELLLSIAIRFACGAVAIGWLLSAIGQLNARGYVCAGVPILLLIAFTSRSAANGPLRLSVPRRTIQWWKRRRILPLIYVATVVLIIAGSVLHEPNNFDGLSYREPKVLFWLEAGRWQWIDSPFGPINYTLPNYEWLTVPIFLVTGSFHSAVIINCICFLFLPSLLFSLLCIFGTPRRFAYDWMWIFPSGYLIAMQAGGIGNDLLGMTAILAALHFARRFVATGKRAFLFDALFAAALCTGVKISNLPLAGFALILLLKDLRSIRAWISTFALAAVLAATVSALIPLILNFIHAGTIFGTTKAGEGQTTSFAAGLVGNTLIILVTCVAPPVFPASHQVAAALERSLGNAAGWLHSNYPKFTLHLNELPQEEGGGLGLGITAVLAISAILYFKYGPAQRSAGGEISPAQRFAWNSWLIFALAVVLGLLATGPALPRNLLPWFPLVLAPILAAIGHGRTPRTKVWRVAAPLISLSVFPALLLTPSRPLIPPPVLLRAVQETGASAATVKRLSVVYDVYAKRPDPFLEIKNALPADARVLGLVSGADEPTTGWLKPFGSRRLVYLTSEKKVAAARESGVQFIVIQESSCRKFFDIDTETWMKRHQAQPIVSHDIRILAAQPPWRYTLATFASATARYQIHGEPRQTAKASTD